MRNVTAEENKVLINKAYQEGFARAREIAKAEYETRIFEAEQKGIRIGRNEVLKEMEGVQCSKLKSIVFSYGLAASICGGGIILSLAVGLSNIH